ncbi:MAG: hypothetical protein AAB974_00015 [Patescibacteria group bacterium]
MRTAEDGWAVGDNGTKVQWGNFYRSPGTFLSTVFDSGASTTTWNRVSWSEYLPANTNLTVAVRTGNTATPDGSWTSYTSEVSDPFGSTISVSAGRYAQYRLSLSTTNQRRTPTLDDISFDANSPIGLHHYDVFMVSATDGWIASHAGGIGQYNGTAWSSFTSPTSQRLSSVSMTSSTDGFMVGNSGTIIRYNGTSWSTISSPTSQQLNSVDMVSGTFGRAVGRNGAVIHWNGSAWSSGSSGTSYDLNAVSMISTTDGFAVGKLGTIRRWNGSAWVSATSPTTNELRGADMISASDGFLVGDAGVILRWNGSTWASVSSPTSEQLNAVHCFSASACFAVGKNGTIIAWDGATWSTETSNTTKDLNSIFCPSATDCWAVGKNGTILHRIPGGGGGGYAGTGTWLSAVLDSGTAGSVWDMIFWRETLVTSTDATFATRTGPTTPVDGSWSGFSAELTDPDGSVIASPAGRYLQYRATLTSTSTLVTPYVDEATATYFPP